MTLLSSAGPSSDSHIPSVVLGDPGSRTRKTHKREPRRPPFSCVNPTFARIGRNHPPVDGLSGTQRKPRADLSNRLSCRRFGSSKWLRLCRRGALCRPFQNSNPQPHCTKVFSFRIPQFLIFSFFPGGGGDGGGHTARFRPPHVRQDASTFIPHPFNLFCRVQVHTAT